MEEIENEPTTIQDFLPAESIESPEPFPQTPADSSTKPFFQNIAAFLRRYRLPVLIGCALLLTSGVVGYAVWKPNITPKTTTTENLLGDLVSDSSKTENTDATQSAEDQQEKTASPEPLGSPTVSKTPSPKATPKAQVTPSTIVLPKPTPTATPADYVFGSDRKIIRSYDDGSGRGAVTTTHDVSSSPSFDPVIDLWNDSIKVCTKIQDNNDTGGILAVLIVEDNGYQVSATDEHPGETICKNLFISTGQHTITLKINPNRTHTESNYGNNTLQFNYTMKGDTQAPTYEIFGPVKDETHGGTCMFVQHITDNLIRVDQLSVEHFIDDQVKIPDANGRICVLGTAGESHTYRVRAKDKAGNLNEQSKPFSLL